MGKIRSSESAESFELSSESNEPAEPELAESESVKSFESSSESNESVESESAESIELRLLESKRIKSELGTPTHIR